MLYNTTLQAIGNTPLIKVNLIKNPLYAKLEYLNPSGSVKDRSASYMIEYAEKHKLLKPGGTIIDASSGNHGVSIAMIGAIKGYKTIITVSEKISKEKLQTIQAYGAQTVMCPSTKFISDPQSYHSQAVALHKKTPNSFMPNQYFNTLNADGHYHSLGPEIWKQTNGKITHFFAGAGTGGTISGTGKYLKEKNSNIKVIAIDSNNSLRSTNGNPKPYKIEGIGIDFKSDVLLENIIDEIITVSDTQGLSLLKPLAQKNGLLAGPSSGAVAYAATKFLRNENQSDILGVMIFGDSGRAYLSKNYY